VCYNVRKGAVTVSDKPKMRCTNHRSRTGTNGKPIGAKHNDRSFDLKQAEHIDPALTSNNMHYFLANGKTEIVRGDVPSGTIDRYEQQFYEEHFSTALELRNESAKRGRKFDRVQTMEQYRLNKKACVEEVILQIGNHNDNIPSELLNECFQEYVEWHRKTYPNVMLIDASFHGDEPNAGLHIQMRQVWAVEVGEGAEKHLEISQKEALKAMGIERPNKEAEEDRRNNAKVTFTAQTRQKWLDIAEEHGIRVERTPKEKGKNGRTLDKLKADTAEEKLRQVEQDLAAAFSRQQDIEREITAAKEEAAAAKKEAAAEKEKLQAAKDKNRTSIVNLLSDIEPKPKPPDKPRRAPWEVWKQSLRPTDSKGRELTGHKLKKAIEEEKARYDEYMLPWVEYDKAYALWEQRYKPLEEVSKVVEQYTNGNRTVKARESAVSEREKAVSEREKSIDNEVKQRLEAREREIFGGAPTSREKRLEQFCEGIKFNDGSSVLDGFNEQEQALKRKFKGR